MGSLFKPKAETTPVQSVENYDVTNKVAGTKQTTVTGADGKKTVVIEQLPLSPDEQAYQDRLKSIRQDQLQYIENITSNYNVDSIPGLKNYLDAYRTTYANSLDLAVKDRTSQEEKALSKYGQADSTAGTQLRATRGADYRAAREQMGRDLKNTEQQIRQQELSNASNLYNSASGGLASIAGNLNAGVNNSASIASAATQLAQSNANSIYNQNAANNNVRFQASQAGLGNFANTIGAFAGLASGTGAAKSLYGKIASYWK